MSKMSSDEVKAKMDELTPEGFMVKGGAFADYTVTLDDGTIYSQSIARVLHANAEHAARGETYNVEIKSIQEVRQVIEHQEVPVLIVTVEVDSPVFGKRQNVMSAIMSTSQTTNDISAMHPVEKAVTQAIGRTLAMYGFAFTGTMVSAEEIREGGDRKGQLQEARKEDPVDMLKSKVASKGVVWEEFLSNNGVAEADMATSRPLVFKLIAAANKL